MYADLPVTKLAAFVLRHSTLNLGEKINKIVKDYVEKLLNSTGRMVFYKNALGERVDEILNSGNSEDQKRTELITCYRNHLNAQSLKQLVFDDAAFDHSLDVLPVDMARNDLAGEVYQVLVQVCPDDEEIKSCQAYADKSANLGSAYATAAKAIEGCSSEDNDERGAATGIFEGSVSVLQKMLASPEKLKQ